MMSFANVISLSWQNNRRHRDSSIVNVEKNQDETFEGFTGMSTSTLEIPR